MIVCVCMYVIKRTRVELKYIQECKQKLNFLFAHAKQNALVWAVLRALLDGPGHQSPP